MACYSDLCYHFHEMCPISTLPCWDTRCRSSPRGKSGNSTRSPSNIRTCVQSSSFLFSFLFSFFSLFLCIFYPRQRAFSTSKNSKNTFEIFEKSVRTFQVNNHPFLTCFPSFACAKGTHSTFAH